MVRRDVVDTCFIDVIRVINKHDLSTADQSLLAAVLISGAIQSALEDAVGNGGSEPERARLTQLLNRLVAFVREWEPENNVNVADDLTAMFAGEAADPHG